MGEKGGGKMSTFTENYDLIKPGNEDFYDIQDFNENMDAIDAQLAEAEEKAAAIQQKMAAVDAQIAQAEEALRAISGKIGSPEDDGKETLFGCVKDRPASFVKSIQYVRYTIPKLTTSGSLAINEVDPEKCIVLFERLQDNSNFMVRMDYTLTATALNVEHYSYTSVDNLNNLFGFWIVELY